MGSRGNCSGARVPATHTGDLNFVPSFQLFRAVTVGIRAMKGQKGAFRLTGKDRKVKTNTKASHGDLGMEGVGPRLGEEAGAGLGVIR